MTEHTDCRTVLQPEKKKGLLLPFFGKFSLALGLAILFSPFLQNALVQQVSAQQVDEESLPLPYQMASDSGTFGMLNNLPEGVRRSAPMARMMYEFERHAGPSGNVNPQARYEAFAKSQQDLYRSSSVASKSGAKGVGPLSNAWTNIGPNVVNSGGSYTVGGCTNDIAIDPSNPSTMYAAAAGGGVWKSSNSGSSWSVLTDATIPDLAVSTIAIDPQVTSTVYVGSGDNYSAGDALNGTGIYKTTDGGSTWTHLTSTTFTSIAKLLVHPTKSNVVFASGFGSQQGLWRSTNSGSTWTKVYTAGGVVWDIVSGGVIGGTGIFYLLDGNNFNSPSMNCGVYKSVDDGVTWNKLSVGIPRGDSISRGALACPTGATNKVYALLVGTVNNSYGNMLGLYKSTNNGLLFSKVTGVPTTIFNPSGSAQGWYDLFLGMSPNAATHDTVFIGGVESWMNWDDGQGWQQINGYVSLGNGDPHVDNHCIALNPQNPKQVFLGTDGGMYYSADAGTSWSSRSNGYSTLRFYHLGLDKNDAHKAYGGAQDEGVWRVVTGSAQVPQILGGDGFSAFSDPTNSNIYYGEGPYGAFYKWNGSNWSSDLATSQTEYGGWDCPIGLAPHNHSNVYTARTHMWFSSNQGSTWSSISPALSGGNTAISMGLSPADARVFWVGFNGTIKMTNDGGTTWISRSTGVPGVNVRGFACHPNDPSWALIALGSYSTGIARLMLTSDQGASWHNVSGSGTTGLPGVSCNAVAVDSVNPNSTWYAATDNGVYYTLDTGKTWSVAGSGLGLSPCWDIQLHPNKTTLRVATHGRGFFEAVTNVLPVELDALKAKTTTSGTLLTWHTDSEKNNLRFDVQRSFNGAAFETLGAVAGAPSGNSNTVREYSFTDPKHDTGDYLFQLAQVDLNGDIHYSNHVEVHYGPRALELSQNFPNPVVLGAAGTLSTTRIDYSIATEATVSVKIYGINGTLVRTLVDNQDQNAGPQEAVWDATDGQGNRVAPATYYYVLTTSNGDQLTGKMLVLQ